MEDNEYDIVVKPSVNKGYVIIRTHHFRVWENISKKFSFKAENFWFSPKYKNGTWDGTIKKLKSDGSLPLGLLDHLIDKVVPDYNYKLKLDGINRNMNYDKEKIQTWIESLNLPFEPRQYQFDAFYESICKKYNGVSAITGSGKSLIIYLLSRFAQRIKKQVLIVVPTIQLVDQMYLDFYKYGFTDVEEHTQKIKAGLDKNFTKSIVISTWQSIQYIKDLDHFKKIEMLIIDEAHGADSKSLMSIQDKCLNASYRVGLSGTISMKSLAEYFTLGSFFGIFKEYLSYQEAFEKGYISPMTLNAMLLEYPESDRNKLISSDYNEEIDFVYNHKARNMFLVKMIDEFTKNTLVLFTKIESHGKILLNHLKEYTKKTIYYIDGSVKDTVREDIRKKMEEENNVILLASFGTFSMGVNIKNIHNVVFASAYRSEIKTFQSIGRGLRTLEDKELQVYDIVDVMNTANQNGTISENYLVNQFKERLKNYKERDFNIIKKRICL